MADKKRQAGEINAAPTKAFFVEMLVRDIPLEQAVLDLVDNCIDGAKRLNSSSFDGREVRIEIGAERFRIIDNCGGFDRKIAKDYAFRFGRPPGMPATPNSIGQFGVGMKRALFKFGRHFLVRSATPDEAWAVDIDVDEWEKDPDDWHFDWASPKRKTSISAENPGTEIIVDRLRPEVAARFATSNFANEISNLIKSKHREFISMGMSISLNGTHLDATSVYVLVGEGLRPGVDTLTFGSQPPATVKVRITVGIGDSRPAEAGWYVICNGRVVLEHDRTRETGWGLIENEQGRAIIPGFHNQFARFRGIVSFDSKDASRLPWNTTKTGINPDNEVWQHTFQRMLEMMRPVINFLNELDQDIDDFTRDESPLYQNVSKASRSKVETFVRKSEFKAPQRTNKRVPKTVKIQYSRPVKDVEFLQGALGEASAKAVGERTFDMILKEQRGK